MDSVLIYNTRVVITTVGGSEYRVDCDGPREALVLCWALAGEEWAMLELEESFL